MISGLKPYPVMKDSGVPWLGMVPEHWEMRKLRHVLRRVTERNRADLPLLSVVREKGVIQRDTTRKETNHNFIPEDLSNYKVVRDGQFAMNKMKAWQGSYGISHHDGIVSPAYFVFDVSGIERDFFHLAIRSRAYVPFFAQASDGVRIGQWDLAESRMKEISFSVPPLPEQNAVVRFLDHFDRKIRRYIRDKQRLIKLLEEQKQAIVQNLVTRGLDPSVRLKASGLEWLAEIPEHWEVWRNGRLFTQRNETGFPDLPILEVSLRTGVRIRDFGNSDRKQIMSDRTKYKRATKNDIAYNMMRMWQGAVGVAPVDGLVSPAYVVAAPKEGTLSRYFGHLFHTSIYMREVDVYSRGIVKDRNRLYWEDFKQMPSLRPPFAEQSRIASAIDERTQAISHGIDQISRQASLLREYRTRLIADVVTGKLDVRKAAAQLPDEAGGEEPFDETEFPTDNGEGIEDFDDIVASEETMEP